MRGVSLEELSSATRISTRFLTAIENGQWEELPGGAFNRGYIRSASRYLGLDEDGMVAEYALETSGGMQPVVFPAATKRQVQTIARRNKVNSTSGPRAWMRFAALAVIAILVIAGGWLAGWKILHRVRARRGTATIALVFKDSAVADNLILVVRVSNPTQVRVKADGQPVFQEEMKAGEQKTFRAEKAFDVSTNNAGAVQLELNGQPVASMGAANRPGSVTLTAKDIKKVKSSVGGSH